MNEVGEFDFAIQDSWGSGIPITDSMRDVIITGVTMASLLGIVRDVMEEVLR